MQYTAEIQYYNNGFLYLIEIQFYFRFIYIFIYSYASGWRNWVDFTYILNYTHFLKSGELLNTMLWEFDLSINCLILHYVNSSLILSGWPLSDSVKKHLDRWEKLCTHLNSSLKRD